MISRLHIAIAISILGSHIPLAAGPHLVENGHPRAQIIIAADAIRPVTLAAEQLQEYIARISGATLPITNAPAGDGLVRIYVGKSRYTDELGIDGDAFKHGGFRMVSGKDWLALVGRDRNYVPPAIWPRKRTDFPEVYEAWDKATGEEFGYPYKQLWKEYHTELGIWEKDEHGSFNATTHFLRRLGVRWYLPDELGEIVPTDNTLVLPQVDDTIVPDFAVRMPLQWARRFSHGWTTRKEALWQWRMGWNQAPDIISYGFGAHGIDDVTESDSTKEAHPEYYALYGGKRCTDFRRGGKPCLSSQGLLAANIRYARALHDVLGAPFLSVMPADAYTSLCQCPLCEGKSTPQAGYRGLLSDYVWNYVNRVATELYTVRPDMRVGCAAYGTYLNPPVTIDRFSPNVVVTLCQHRQNFYDEEEHQNTLAKRKAFVDKLGAGGKIMINEKYRSGGHQPQFFPHIIAADLKSLKGISLGGRYEVFRQPKGGIGYLPAMHLNLYVTSRFWWDADQDIDALLEEYYARFYGPANDEMQRFIEYSEEHWAEMGKSAEAIDKAFELIGEAEKKVTPESVYARRIAWIHDFIQPLEGLKKKFEMGRVDVPEAHVTPIKKDKYEKITVDGNLDEKVWSTWPSYALKELQSGGKPTFGTRFKVVWDDRAKAICFGVTCRENDTANLNIGTTKNEDMNIFNGDVVEILLETLSHSYYQIVISPSGALLDLDRADGIETLWSSEARVATRIGKDAWTVEIVIPVAGENQDETLPLSGVAGSAPTPAYPWFFNVCRARVREDGVEGSAFSPTGEKGFHHVMKFGKLCFRPKPKRK